MNEDLKRCSKCDIEKELSKNILRYRNQCRDCIKLINKVYQTMNEDEIKIQRKEYRENIKNKNLKRLYDIHYRERNREKIQS